SFTKVLSASLAAPRRPWSTWATWQGWPSSRSTCNSTMLSTPPLTATHTGSPGASIRSRRMVRSTSARMAQGVQHGARLVLAFLEFLLGAAPGRNGTAGDQRGPARGGVPGKGADHHVQIRGAVGENEADGAAEDPAPHVLRFIDQLHGPQLGRTGHAGRGKGSAEQVHGRDACAHPCAHGAHQLVDVWVGLHAAKLLHLHGPWRGNAAEVVAGHVHGHDVLTAFLGVFG